MSCMEDILGCCRGGSGWVDMDCEEDRRGCKCCEEDRHECEHHEKPCNCRRHDPVEECFEAINNDLCDMDEDVEECKAALLCLAKIIAKNNCCGCICKEEKALLLFINSKLNDLGCDINETKSNVCCLENLVTC